MKSTHVDHPSFHEPGAEQRFAAMTIPTVRAGGYPRDQERDIFLLYNFARMRSKDCPSWRRVAERCENALVESNVGMVHRFATSQEAHDDREDQIAEGTFALLRAIRRFDVSRGLKLSTSACVYIKHEALSRNVRCGRAKRKAWRSTVLFTDMEAGGTAGELRYDPADESIMAGEIDREHAATIVADRLSLLSERHRLVFLSRFRDGTTFRELAEERGVTRQRIQQIEAEARRLMLEQIPQAG